MKDITKHYTNGELTIVWKPAKCIHSAECVKALPEVYKPKEKPWIQADGADTQALKDQIAKCPSGALSYLMNDSEDQEELSLETKVEALKDGPLLIYGTLNIKNSDGSEEKKKRPQPFADAVLQPINPTVTEVM